ncbi:MAG: NAD(P)/FAD-dependent oxidoreductase [Desulfuromonadaceae bacterium]|nr:NAD(P)/FAD-dependent oxidoreductase [Desulfuromonadaceae bacterium]
MIFDTVIIGSGVSGLTTALILSRLGRRVAVVEKSEKAAPLVRGFNRGGIYFDSAFHYAGGLGDGEILDLYFRYLGIDRLVHKVPLDRCKFDIFRDSESGREFCFPSGIAALQEALCRIFPREARGIGSYLAHLEAVFRRLPYLNPEAVEGTSNMVEAVQGPSLDEVLRRFIRDPGLCHLLSLHTLLHGVSPQEIPFSIHAGVAFPFYRSAHRIAGGGRALAEAFVSRIHSAGIPLIQGRSAKGMSFSSAGHLKGVELADGESIACRECVVTIHPRRFLDLAPEGALRPAYRKRLMGLEETFSGCILFLHGQPPPQILTGSNLYLGFSRQGLAEKLPEWERRLLFVAGGASPPDSVKTDHGWSVICPASWLEMADKSGRAGNFRAESYRAAKEEVSQRIFQRLAREAPEIVEGARLVEVATPLTLRDYCGGPEGGIYGVRHALGQYNPQAATRIPHVYLSGQATAAPGILGAMVSAFLTCGHILGHDRLRREIMI